MIRFFEGELARRGAERSMFEGTAVTGGPLYGQILLNLKPVRQESVLTVRAQSSGKVVPPVTSTF